MILQVRDLESGYSGLPVLFGVNFKVDDKAAMMRKLSETFRDARQDTLDGLTIEYADWWFNARPSNTEPFLRLNLEASTSALLESGRAKLYAILGRPV